MKHLLFTLFLTALFFSVDAQIEKGAILTGGHLNYSKSDQETDGDYSYGGNEYNSTQLIIAPQIGFFVSESTLLGIGINYEHADSKSEYFGYDYITTYKNKRNLFFINPYLTKYSKLKDKLYFTTNINLMAGVGKENDNKVFAFRANVTPGMSYFVSKKWAVTCSIGRLYYNHKKTDVEDSSEEIKNNNYGINLDLNTFTLGVQFVLNTRSKE